MKDELKYLSQMAAIGKLSRRSFMGRAGALGLSATAAGTLLSSAVMAQGAQKGGTIRVGISGGSSTDSLDPATSANSTSTQISRLWGEPLVELGADGSLEPKVATEWGATADAKTWTFVIREGITFSNGKTVTAEDVLATFERHAGEDSESGALGLLKDIASMGVDGNSFVVTLNTGNACLLYTSPSPRDA